MTPTIDQSINGTKLVTKSSPVQVGDKILISTSNGTKYGIVSGPPIVGNKVSVYGSMNPMGLIWPDVSIPTCVINLWRFALVYGSTTADPITHTGTTYYSNNYPFIQCGRLYQGYITLLFILASDTAVAAIELRICKDDPTRLVIETYGEIAPTTPISVWFNSGSIESPSWNLLNSTTTGVILPYNQKAYTFTETSVEGIITIDCCIQCLGCGCITCTSNTAPTGVWKDTMTDPPSTMTKAFVAPVLYKYGVRSYGRFTYYGTMTNVQSGSTLTSKIEYWVEFKYSCEKIEFWAYAKFTCLGSPAAGSSNLTLTFTRDGQTATILNVNSPNTPYAVYDTEITYSSVIFNYLKNCVGSKTCKICGNKTTTITTSINNPCVVVGRKVRLSSNACTTEWVGYRLTGSYEAIISEVDVPNNALTFSNIVFTGVSTDRLSDRTCTVTTPSFSFYAASPYDTPVPGKNIGYCGPPCGRDAFFICDISGSCIIPDTVPLAQRWIRFFIAPATYPYYTCGSKQFAMAGSGTYSGTLDPKIAALLAPVCRYTTVKSQIYFNVDAGASGISISVDVSNVRVVDCRGNPYVAENIVPTGGSQVGSFTMLMEFLL